MNIKETAQKYSDYVVDIRRRIHMNPELSTKEFETSKLVCEELDKIGVPYERIGELGTAVLATVQGALPGREHRGVGEFQFRELADSFKQGGPAADDAGAVVERRGEDDEIYFVLHVRIWVQAAQR